MAKNLVIVESPAKSKTIKKFLGSNYKVVASMGHVRDLPKSSLGIDLENNFEPKYITIRGKGELLKGLRKEVKNANKVYLATDPDREGEAISWHLMYALNLFEKKTYRITFNEITKTAVKNSIKNAREIDENLVDAQQARRLLDRIVGYKMSPVLWKKVKKGLSAGRVQSVALKLICDREEEIEAFIPEEYYTLDVDLKDKRSKKDFKVAFFGKGKTKMTISSREQVDEIISAIQKDEFKIKQILRKQKKTNSPLPFKTSTMQQEASRLLNFSPIKTMRIAQQLYEGIDIKGKGTVGLITYLRTDSTRVSDEAHVNVLTYIEEKYGKEYLSDKKKNLKKGGAQDAHEAIRPTYLELEADEIKGSLSRDQYKLYSLIYKRFVASRMAAAVYDTVAVKVASGGYVFAANSSKLVFDGYLALSKNKSNAGIEVLHDLKEEDKLDFIKYLEEQHFTKHPPRFTEATLIKILEDNGVGRPSTYAPTISTIMSRGYINKENKQIFPTELGTIVNKIISGYFQDVINMEFTAELEAKLDRVEQGDFEWKSVLRDFYPPFHDKVAVAEKEIEKIELKYEETDVKCDKCGRNMVIKLGKYGKFLACPGFPECRNAMPYLVEIEGVSCPKCSEAVVERKTKKGRKYYGCKNNPDCDFMVWNKPTKYRCEECGDIMLEKGKKLMCANDECKHIADLPAEVSDDN